MHRFVVKLGEHVYSSWPELTVALWQDTQLSKGL